MKKRLIESNIAFNFDIVLVVIKHYLRENGGISDLY